jgi:Zn finger protein HypA/HybF involved in hydrogenase expression
MATKIPIAQKRMFEGVFVCKNCNQKIRSESVRVNARRVNCPKCSGRAFRPVKRKK